MARQSRSRRQRGEIRQFKVVENKDPDIPRFLVVDWFGKVCFMTDDYEQAWREAGRLNGADLSLRTADKRWTKFNHR